MNLLAASDWWNSIKIFFHEMDMTVKILVIAILVILGLLMFIRFLKPFYSADKNKTRFLMLIPALIFLGLAFFIIFI